MPTDVKSSIRFLNKLSSFYFPSLFDQYLSSSLCHLCNIDPGRGTLQILMAETAKFTEQFIGFCWTPVQYWAWMLLLGRHIVNTCSRGLKWNNNISFSYKNLYRICFSLGQYLFPWNTFIWNIKNNIKDTWVLIKTSLLRKLQSHTLPVETPPVGKIHPFSKTAVFFGPMMQFWYPLRFIFPLPV